MLTSHGLRKLGLIAVLPLALAACGGAGASRNYISAVGSSTVYPFATTAAETLVAGNPDLRIPKIESTGTGGGIERFCNGIGAGTPDIVNASRRMKRSEYDSCAQNGARDIIELQIGIDGLALGQSVNGRPLRLTREQVYRALALTPYGRPNRARTWADIDPALPPVAISVLGPPTTSGTFDAFKELVLAKGCESDPTVKALKDSDKARYDAICFRLRGAPWFVEQGENDNLIVQKLSRNPDSVGIFGFSYLNANRSILHAIPMEGVDASPATIVDGSYPGARPLFVYVKARHLDVIPGLREFMDVIMLAARPGGPLVRRGMIALPPEQLAVIAATARAATPLDPADLK
jgi:phosphate transport system substrate-binding protein